jgi:hypothetical protein
MIIMIISFTKRLLTNQISQTRTCHIEPWKQERCMWETTSCYHLLQHVVASLFFCRDTNAHEYHMSARSGQKKIPKCFLRKEIPAKKRVHRNFRTLDFRISMPSLKSLSKPNKKILEPEPGLVLTLSSSVFLVLCIRLHTSVLSNIRDHTSVSICQRTRQIYLIHPEHTSAYVSWLKNGLTCHLDYVVICYDIFWVHLEYITTKNWDKKNTNRIG